MPYVSISLLEGRSEEQKNAIAKRIADAIIEELGVQATDVWIRFQDTALSDWFTGPDSEAELRKRRAVD